MTDCINDQCDGTAQYAAWDGSSFARVVSACEDSPHDPGDLHPFICAECFSLYEKIYHSYEFFQVCDPHGIQAWHPKDQNKEIEGIYSDDPKWRTCVESECNDGVEQWVVRLYLVEDEDKDEEEILKGTIADGIETQEDAILRMKAWLFDHPIII